MKIVAEVEALFAKVEGEAKEVVSALLGHARIAEGTIIGAMEAEVNEGSAELKAAWAKLKSLL